MQGTRWLFFARGLDVSEIDKGRVTSGVMGMDFDGSAVEGELGCVFD